VDCGIAGFTILRLNVAVSFGVCSNLPEQENEKAGLRYFTGKKKNCKDRKMQ